MNKLLMPASRQYMHNDGSGLVCGFDKDLTEKIVDKQLLRIEKLEFALGDLLNDCINFDGGKLTDVKIKQASEILKAH
jgi:hypothetical protein